MSRTRVARRAAALALYTAGAVGIYDLLEPRTPEHERYALRQRVVRRYIRMTLSLFGAAPDYVPREPPPASRGRLVVANHRTGLDIAVLLGYFGGHVLSRADVAKWPILGYGARRAETLFVDRSSGHSGAQAIRTIRRQLQQGRTVIAFPEGTTFADDEVREFKPGVFAAAAGLDVEVVPVGLAYEPGVEYVDMTFGEHLQRVAARRTTKVAACIGEPIAARRSAETAASAQAAVQALVHEARRRLR